MYSSDRGEGEGSGEMTKKKKKKILKSGTKVNNGEEIADWQTEEKMLGQTSS